MDSADHSAARLNDKVEGRRKQKRTPAAAFTEQVAVLVSEAQQAPPSRPAAQPAKRSAEKVIDLASAPSSASTPSREERGGKKSKHSHASPWAFEVDYNDHFETPLRAYEDLSPVLEVLSEALGKNKEELALYDPYYCQGQMREHLRHLGYPSVINQNRDFYKDIKRGLLPAHDMLVTNPPYSGEHKVRLLNYLRDSTKPFALLLPAYIVTKAYWKAFVETHCSQGNLYILPPDYYHYNHPEGTGKPLPPFYSAWLVGGLDASQLGHAASKLRDFAKRRAMMPLPSPVGLASPLKPAPVRQLTVARSVQEMVRLGVVTDSNRPNPKQRRKLMKQKLGAAVSPANRKG